ncbi:hypothetical protein ABGB18_41395 [Nonomuraea sp. B12E4]|uniref:hypothetical protein n=1 Tax=Nonomuraea sp. B12E4 TaxID=3153564 RepID=UPI00325CA90F
MAFLIDEQRRNHGTFVTQVTGVGEGTVPLLLIVDGAATVTGNTIVGRLTDRPTISVQVWGPALNLIF